MSAQPADKTALEFITKISFNKTKEKYKLVDEFSKLIFPPNMENTLFGKDTLALLLDGDPSKSISTLDFH